MGKQEPLFKLFAERKERCCEDMKIIVDAFGGDNAPLEILMGCAQAVAEYDLDVMLTGREAEIRRVAEENEISLNRMELVDTPDIITMEDHAGDIMKSKSQSSMAAARRRKRRRFHFRGQQRRPGGGLYLNRKKDSQD